MTDKERLTLYRSIKSGNLPDKQRLETYRALKENREDVSDLITSFAFADKDRNKSLSDLMSEKEPGLKIKGFLLVTLQIWREYFQKLY